MKFTALIPTLYTQDIRGSVEFYSGQLGFECGDADEDHGYAFVHRDNVTIMLAYPNTHQPFEKAIFTGSLYIHCDDVDKVWEKVKDSVRMCYPIEDFEYGMREFAIFDNNGYLLQFGQELARL